MKTKQLLKLLKELRFCISGIRSSTAQTHHKTCLALLPHNVLHQCQGQKPVQTIWSRACGANGIGTRLVSKSMPSLPDFQRTKSLSNTKSFLANLLLRLHKQTLNMDLVQKSCILPYWWCKQARPGAQPPLPTNVWKPNQNGDI